MAVDEALVENSRVTGVPVLRLYGWQEATLSLGYFQGSAVPARFGRLPLVRRLSGGGAIVHHHEVTYSLSIPAGHPLAVQPSRLYRQVHTGIAGALASLGVAVDRRGEVAFTADAPGEGPEQSAPLSTRNVQPFLCFLRRNPDDLVRAGSKVAGSAQRRRRGALLQHGSLVLAASPDAPEVIGLCELTHVELSLACVRQRLVKHVLECVHLRAEAAQLEDNERRLAAHLASAKYGARCWNLRR
jgi:lipoate-protein ligase A